MYCTKKKSTQTDLNWAFVTYFPCAVNVFRKKNVFYFFVLTVFPYLAAVKNTDIHRLLNWLCFSLNMASLHRRTPFFSMDLHDEYHFHIRRRGTPSLKWITESSPLMRKYMGENPLMLDWSGTNEVSSVGSILAWEFFKSLSRAVRLRF